MCLCCLYKKTWNSIFCILLRTAVDHDQNDRDLVRVWANMDNTNHEFIDKKNYGISLGPVAIEMTVDVPKEMNLPEYFHAPSSVKSIYGTF